MATDCSQRFSLLILALGCKTGGGDYYNNLHICLPPGKISSDGQRQLFSLRMVPIWISVTKIFEKGLIIVMVTEERALPVLAFSTTEHMILDHIGGDLSWI